MIIIKSILEESLPVINAKTLLPGATFSGVVDGSPGIYLKIVFKDDFMLYNLHNGRAIKYQILHAPDILSYKKVDIVCEVIESPESTE